MSTEVENITLRETHICEACGHIDRHFQALGAEEGAG